jgi:hypothetical protein
MSTLEVEVDGLRRLNTKLAKSGARLRHSLDEAVGDAAETLLEATLPFVPVETWNLHDSGHVAKNADADYSVVFGGTDAPYAIYVHEILEYEHKPPTKAKFLEDTYLATRAGLADSIKDKAVSPLRGA